MKGIISIIAGGIVIFVAISMYLAYSKFLLRRAYDSLEGGNFEKTKFLARLLSFTPFKACGYEIQAEIAQLNEGYEDAASLFGKALELDNTLENSWVGLFECQ